MPEALRRRLLAFTIEARSVENLNSLSISDFCEKRRRDVHAASEGVLSSRVDEVASLLKLGVLVHEHSEDRSKDLVDHGDGLGVLRDDDRRLDVVTLRVVSRSSSDDLSSGGLGSCDHAHNLVERSLVAVISLVSWSRAGDRMGTNMTGPM